MSGTPLTVLHSGHRKAMRIGANDNMSTVVQVGVLWFQETQTAVQMQLQARPRCSLLLCNSGDML